MVYCIWRRRALSTQNGHALPAGSWGVSKQCARRARVSSENDREDRGMRRLAAIGLLMLLVLPASTAAATPIGNDAFARTWAYTDQPVADGTVQRTWMWGPQPFTGILREDSAESPG